jgi:hypothetical protein
LLTGTQSITGARASKPSRGKQGGSKTQMSTEQVLDCQVAAVPDLHGHKTLMGMRRHGAYLAPQI